MIIKKETPIHKILEAYPQTARFFDDLNMSCGGCFAVNFDTIENGAMMHGMEINALLAKLEKFIGGLPASVPPTDPQK